MIFGVDAMPGWLRLDASTGELSGTPGAGDVGMHRGIVVWVTDGAETAVLPAFDLTVTPVSRAGNMPPTISGTPASSVTAGTLYDFVPIANDPNGDPLVFQSANVPPWATFDSITGRVSGTPGPNDIGVFQNVVVNVSDGLLSAALPQFLIVVNPPPSANTPPAISGTPVTSVLEGSSYSFKPTASDVDGDALTFMVVNKPPWASFDSFTGELSGTPGSGDVGLHDSISIIVRDGQAWTALAPFSISVQGLNSPPVISGVPANDVTVGNSYAFVPTASDPDGDSLVFSIVNRPAWANFDTVTGGLSGTPGSSDVGTVANIRISVSDGSASDSLGAFSITVDAANSPPSITGSPAPMVTQNATYAFTPTAADPDGDSLVFAIANKPAWATFDNATGELTGTPGAGNVGAYNAVTITVSDGIASAQLAPFSITVVAAANGSATLTWVPPTQNDDGSPLTDLAGYVVHWGTVSGTYTSSAPINNPGISTYVVDNLISGTTYYFAVKALNQQGIQSSFSNEAIMTIP